MKYFNSRSIQILSLVLVLQMLTYWHYYIGLTVTNGDVNAHYLSDGYFWWNNGGILNPPEWISYAWMGRPAGSNLQDSSFVLPAGITYLLGNWTPTSIAVMSSFVTSFGALGMYLLVKKMTGNHVVALLGLIGQFFTANIFSNAQFLDFHRGAAYVPWFLLVMSPKWFWNRRWGIPIAAVIFWQIFVGVYPGQLIVAFYILSAWFITWIFTTQNKTWVWRCIVSGVLGFLLALPKYILALSQGTGDRDWEEQRYKFSFESLATMFFPYGNENFEYDIALRSFFVVVPLLFLLVYGITKGKSVPPKIFFSFSILFLTLSIFPEGVLYKMPGMDLSRFVVNDIKNYFLASIIILGCYGFISLLNKEITKFSVIISSAILTLIFLLSYLFTIEIPSGPKGVLSFTFPIILCCATIFVFLNILNSHPDGSNIKKYTFFLISLAVASGLFSAYSTTSPWASSKDKVETAAYGEMVKNLIDNSHCGAALEVPRRPERLVPESDPVEWWHDTKALRGAFDCSESLGGYTNVPGNPTLIEQQREMSGDNSDTYIKFFSAPGSIFSIDSNGLPLIDELCIDSGKCESYTFESLKYMQSGQIVYNIDSQKKQTVLINESYYKGWVAKACYKDGNCTPVALDSGVAKSIQANIPEGEYELRFEYKQPYRSFSLSLFWVSAGLVLLSFLVRGQRETEEYLLR